jgi:hypothetical protein
MLRLAVLLLVLANAGYFAWSQGFLRDWGFAPTQTTEPQRLQQQIKPDAVRVMPAADARAAEPVSAAAAAGQSECLLAGPLDDTQLAPVRQALAAWPAGSWSLEPAAPRASWLVYMGKYENVEQLARKKAELRQIGIAFEAPGEPALEPGLALGRHGAEADANAQLQELARQGVRSARLVQQRSEARGQVLKLPALDERLRPRLDALRPVLNAIKLRPCRLDNTGDR